MSSIDNQSKDQQLKIKQQSAWRHSLSLAFELGYLIAGPLVVLGVVGRLADRHWGTGPLWLLVGVIVSILVSSLLIIRKIKEIIAESGE